MSTASAGACTGSILARMVATAPEISSTVSPRTRSAIRKPPIWLGVASPDITMSKAARASSKSSALPAATFAICALKSLITVPSEAQCLRHRVAIDAHTVLPLQFGHHLVEQVVGKAARQAVGGLLRNRGGVGIERLGHLGHLVDDLRIAVGAG